MYREKSFHLADLYESSTRDKRLRKRIQEINKSFDNLRKTEKHNSITEINKVITWSTSFTSGKDIYEYQIVKAKKHFILFSTVDNTYQISQIESLIDSAAIN